MDDLSKLSYEELLAMRNQLQSQGKDVVPAAQPTAETDLTGIANATGKDMGKGAYHGATQAFGSTFGAPADFLEYGAQVNNYLRRVANPDYPPREPQYPNWGSNAMQRAVDNYVTGLVGGKIGKPESGLGKLTERAVAYWPALLGGKEAYFVRPFTRIAGPMAGESAAGALTKDSEYQPAAEMAGALLGGPLAGRAITPFRAPDPMRTVLSKNLLKNDIDATDAVDRTGNRMLATIRDATGKPKWASEELFNQQMMEQANKMAGVPGHSFRDLTTGDKTVYPAKALEYGKHYNAFEQAAFPRLSPADQLIFAGLKDQAAKRPYIESVLSTRGKKDFDELNKRYAIVKALEKAGEKSDAVAHLTPKEIANVTRDYATKPLHNLASAGVAVKEKVDPLSDKFLAGLLGVAATGGAAGAMQGLHGDSNLYGLGGTAAAGLTAGGLASHYGPGYLKSILALAGPVLNRRATQRVMGNQAVPQRMREIGPSVRIPKTDVRIPTGVVPYSTNLRNPREEDE